MPYPEVPTAEYSYTGFQFAQQDNDFPGTQLDNDLENLINAFQEFRNFLEVTMTSEGRVRTAQTGIVITVSEDPPSGGTDGDLWFQVQP
jgi:hypothetical protein